MGLKIPIPIKGLENKEKRVKILFPNLYLIQCGHVKLSKNLPEILEGLVHVDSLSFGMVYDQGRELWALLLTTHQSRVKS